MEPNIVSSKAKNKKKFIIAIIIIIITLLVVGAVVTQHILDENIVSQSDDVEQLSYQAPNMWVQWQDSSEDDPVYDAMTIDWRCIDNADGTYWAVHCWDFGYAGFQVDTQGNNVLLMSLWDLDDGTKPEIEYFSSDYNYGDFTHEGCGAYVFTPYVWEVGIWYSMKIEITYENDSTYFTQYIRKESGPWEATATIKYPTYYELNNPPAGFQEDYGINNLKRSCEIKNAGGRVLGTNEWEMWDACEITTSFYPDTTNPESCVDNISFNCDYEVYDSTIKLISGGGGFDTNEKEYPIIINF